MKAPTMFMSLTGTQAIPAGEIPGVLDQDKGAPALVPAE